MRLPYPKSIQSKCFPPPLLIETLEAKKNVVPIFLLVHNKTNKLRTDALMDIREHEDLPKNGSKLGCRSLMRSTFDFLFYYSVYILEKHFD